MFPPMPTMLARLAMPGIRRVAALAALSTLPLLGGCLGSDTLTGNNNGGQFTATVAGDLQGPLSGNAELVQVGATSTTPAGLAVGMLDPSGTVIALQWPNVTTLAIGTTNVGTDSTKTAMTMVLPNRVTGARFIGTAGTVTITAVTPTSATGSFSVGAAATDTKESVTITGNFVATVLGSTSP